MKIAKITDTAPVILVEQKGITQRLLEFCNEHAIIVRYVPGNSLSEAHFRFWRMGTGKTVEGSADVVVSVGNYLRVTPPAAKGAHGLSEIPALEIGSAYVLIDDHADVAL